MKIYIPTYMRPHSQPLYEQLSEAGYDPVLIVDKTDPRAKEYLRWPHVSVAVRGIARKREWIAKHAKGIYVVADDDLLILTVGRDGRTRVATRAGVRECMDRIELLAHHYPHGAVHRRAFVNSAAHLNYKINTSGYGSLLFYNQALWRRRPVFRTHGLTGPDYVEDLSSQISLFKQGLPFAVITSHCTKEVHAKDHYQTGCWAFGTTAARLEQRERVAAALLAFWRPALRQHKGRTIIDWRATAREWQVPEHLNGKPRLGVNR